MIKNTRSTNYKEVEGIEKCIRDLELQKDKKKKREQRREAEELCRQKERKADE